jgi:hypothetical protein
VVEGCRAGEPEVLFMTAAPSIFSAGNLLKKFAFTYFPVTDWRRFFSPVIVFGNANIADSEIEQEVVDRVGSYGYQLNRILDALAVLIREGEDPKKPRTEGDLRTLYRLLDLADAADQAATQARTKT